MGNTLSQKRKNLLIAVKNKIDNFEKMDGSDLLEKSINSFLSVTFIPAHTVYSNQCLAIAQLLNKIPLDEYFLSRIEEALSTCFATVKQRDGTYKNVLSENFYLKNKIKKSTITISELILEYKK